MNKFTKSALFLSVLAIVLFPQRAHAYLDANTVSYLLQIGAAAIFGGLFLLKTWWTEVKRIFSNLLLRKDDKNSAKSSDKSK